MKTITLSFPMLADLLSKWDAIKSLTDVEPFTVDSDCHDDGQGGDEISGVTITIATPDSGTRAAGGREI